MRGFWQMAPIIGGLIVVLTAHSTRMLVFGAVVCLLGAILKPKP